MLASNAAGGEPSTVGTTDLAFSETSPATPKKDVIPTTTALPMVRWMTRMKMTRTKNLSLRN